MKGLVIGLIYLIALAAFVVTALWIPVLNGPYSRETGNALLGTGLALIALPAAAFLVAMITSDS